MKNFIAAAMLIAALPIYPGATHASDMTNKGCGTVTKSATYQVHGVGWRSVTNWYRDRIAGAIEENIPGQPQGGQLFAHDGRTGVVVLQSTSATVFTLTTYDPPLSLDRITAMRAAYLGDAAAMARLKAQCGES